MNLYVDIESIPTQRADLKELIIKDISPPGNISKPESIEKWIKEKKPTVIEEKYRATALNGAFGEIVCIGWAFDDEAPQVLYRDLHQSEEKVLHDFSEIVYDRAFAKPGQPQAIKWIGHYLTGFDLRFLWQRYVINSLQPQIKIPYDVKPWADNVFDTKIEWTGLTGRGGKLDETCHVMGYEGKGDIDGSKVWDYVQAGKIEEVAEYCKDDVVKTRLLYKRMTFSVFSDISPF